MRTNILMALSFSLLALFAISTYAIDNRYGFSADQLIDASRGIYPSGPSPQEARANWGKISGTDHTEQPDAPENSNIAINQTAPSPKVATPSATSAAGNWLFSLKDSENRSMTLTLSQSGNVLLGVGTMNEDNRTQIDFGIRLFGWR